MCNVIYSFPITLSNIIECGKCQKDAYKHIFLLDLDCTWTAPGQTCTVQAVQAPGFCMARTLPGLYLDSLDVTWSLPGLGGGSVKYCSHCIGSDALNQACQFLLGLRCLQEWVGGSIQVGIGYNFGYSIPQSSRELLGDTLKACDGILDMFSGGSRFPLPRGPRLWC